MGPIKWLSQPPTGQTGLAQADRIKFELVIYRMSFELMTMFSLITGD